MRGETVCLYIHLYTQSLKHAGTMQMKNIIWGRLACAAGPRQRKKHARLRRAHTDYLQVVQDRAPIEKETDLLGIFVCLHGLPIPLCVAHAIGNCQKKARPVSSRTS